ncbi:MAG TPA: hypothetical protein VFW86_02560 [Candidatus Limnocylindrales bacterium]|jgi:hypothetical protein|nr:hypothetical protein [Candidatus Limnocylindrales bacterium]
MQQPRRTGATTTGTDEREPRDLAPIVGRFDLPALLVDLRNEPEWRAGDRNARTLLRDGVLRLTLSILRPGAQLDELNGDGWTVLQALEGAFILETARAESPLEAGVVTAIAPGEPWSVRATSEGTLLLTRLQP